MKTTKDGFRTADDTTLMSEIVRILEADALWLNARLEHTGGGVFCVVTDVLEHSKVLYWGTSGENWNADVCDPDGGFLGSMAFPVPSTTKDAGMVARFIRDAVAALVPFEK